MAESHYRAGPGLPRRPPDLRGGGQWMVLQSQPGRATPGATGLREPQEEA